ncbi:helix-turn-helix domain-containing protein [Paraburkholderia sp. BL21I4N1]|uniref:AraC family transcriptional regulator n=1 Tax=Paraburkholderia sp. BL21I4N1 TaxID=1938801 RepID=UPI000CFB76B8|nr:helix-turn-helix transcriptional regulator [Paraburkholderia sp. BL21I4N1]PQV54227.1 AraC family transcriptional regulator [Paraburkholderia sp. BL21I4N1]
MDKSLVKPVAHATPFGGPVTAANSAASANLAVKASAENRPDLPIVFGQAIEYESGAREIAHTHPRAQLLYATSGVIRVRTPGTSWVVTPDRALLVPPRVEHELEMVGKVSFRTVYVDPCPMCGDEEGRLLAVNALLREAILALVTQPARNPPPGSLADVLAQLIVHLLAAAATEDLGSIVDQAARLPLPQHPRLRKICQALIDEPANSDSLEYWGDRIGASSRTLARHFQRETGMPFAKWREQMRASEAMCRLSTSTPINEVAAYLGYADANTFAVMFKRVLHMTPLKYQSMMNPATPDAPQG